MRILIGALVVSVHVALGWIFAHGSIQLIRVTHPIVPISLLTIAPKPLIRVSTETFVKPLKIKDFGVKTPPSLGIKPEPMALPALTSNGQVVPPHPMSPLTDPKMFAQRAGLAAGSGVTVVLGVEVLANGTIGRVRVEVSGGSSRIDSAAIEYVHSLQWVGGRASNQPKTFWIRWGVRLDG